MKGRSKQQELEDYMEVRSRESKNRITSDIEAYIEGRIHHWKSRAQSAEALILEYYATTGRDPEYGRFFNIRGSRSGTTGKEYGGEIEESPVKNNRVAEGKLNAEIQFRNIGKSKYVLGITSAYEWGGYLCIERERGTISEKHNLENITKWKTYEV